MTDTARTEAPQRTVSETHKGPWPGWIWAVPIAAVAIVAWLMARQWSARGTEVTVTFDDAAQLKADTTLVFYRGIQIGKVSDVKLSKDGSKADVKLKIDDEEKKYLTSGTRFYLSGENPTLSDLGSLKALIAGPSVEMLPGDGPPARSYVGLSGEAPQRLKVAVPYRVSFGAQVGQLKAGDSVTLRGFEVGEVTAVELKVDPKDGKVLTEAFIALDPTRFHIQGAVSAGEDWTTMMNDTLSRLVEHQWRARLAQSPPIIGGQQIELASVSGAPPATLRTSEISPEIPTVESAGIEHLVEAAGQFPLQQIGQNVQDITSRMKTLLASGKLQDSMSHLDAALAQLDQTLHEAGPKVAPTIQSAHDTIDQLRKSAGELDATVKDARALIGAQPGAPDGSLEPTLAHVSEAARAMRVLANYVDEHPESLLKGRAK